MGAENSDQAPDARAAEAPRVPVGRARALFQRAFSLRHEGEVGEFKDSGVGRLLCATRMRLGKDLQHIGQVLHIRYTYLVAIEDGRYEDLPGQAYAIGFVRAYADHLGLDGDEVVRRFKEESTGLRRKAALDFPIPTPDSGIPSGLSILAAALLGMAIYGVWYGFAGMSRTFPLVQEVPARLTGADAAPADAQPAAPEQTDEAAADTPQPPTSTTDATAPEAPPADATATAQPAAAPPAAAAPAPAVAPPVDFTQTDTLEVRAKVDSWIQIRKGDELLLTKLLKKGDVYKVTEPGLTLMTGNAGGIEVLLNGEVMPPLGENGAVASGVPLDPAHFRSED
jgi:cytoskeleton protein RodZ